jgi:putative glycosyl hydrolase-like family 15 (GHL15) protein
MLNIVLVTAGLFVVSTSAIAASGGGTAAPRGAVMQNTRAPKIVAFNVQGPVDYRVFRYAYTSCLLDDGYFSFNDKVVMYSSVPWFDEYDFKLGEALSGPPAAAWSQGVWRRDFSQVTLRPKDGIVLRR